MVELKNLVLGEIDSVDENSSSALDDKGPGVADVLSPHLRLIVCTINLPK